MKTKFNIIEVLIVCILFSLLLKAMWFMDWIPDDDKWSGFTGYSAMKYELWQSHLDKDGVQIGAWIKFIFNLTTSWIFMFSISCLPVAIMNRIVTSKCKKKTEGDSKSLTKK